MIRNYSGVSKSSDETAAVVVHLSGILHRRPRTMPHLLNHQLSHYKLSKSPLHLLPQLLYKVNIALVRGAEMNWNHHVRPRSTLPTEPKKIETRIYSHASSTVRLNLWHAKWVATQTFNLSEDLFPGK